MKFIHCADLHLQSKIESLPSKISFERKEEILKTFEKLCDYAVSNNVKAVIIAGDMFDANRVTLKTQKRIYYAISKCANVDFLCLTGNHDKDVFDSFVALPRNLYFFNDEWTKFNYKNVCISGIKLTKANSMLASETLELNEHDVNIVVLHGQTANYNLSHEEELVSLPKFRNKFIDYLALGHIHSYSSDRLDQRGVYAYSGCLDARGFDELGQKGFVMLDVEDNEIKHEFIPFSSRIFYEFEYDLTEKTDYFAVREEILSVLKNRCSSSSLVKVILKGEQNIDFGLDVAGLKNTLNLYFYYAKVYDKTSLKIDVKDYETDKSVRGEFVKKVLGATDIDEQMKKEILLCGLNALKGEDI